MRPNELRAVAEAARRACQDADTLGTCTNGELHKLKKIADEAHAAWIAALNETLCGSRFDAPAA